jgi:hypothetical protein
MNNRVKKSVSTMFTRNKRIEAQMRRVNTLVAPDAAFESAIGDDALMERAEYDQHNENAYCMTEAFESDEDGELVVQTTTVPAPITTETLDEEIELVYTPAESNSWQRTPSSQHGGCSLTGQNGADFTLT